MWTHFATPSNRRPIVELRMKCSSCGFPIRSRPLIGVLLSLHILRWLFRSVVSTGQLIADREEKYEMIFRFESDRSGPIIVMMMCYVNSTATTTPTDRTRPAGNVVRLFCGTWIKIRVATVRQSQCQDEQWWPIDETDQRRWERQRERGQKWSEDYLRRRFRQFAQNTDAPAATAAAAERESDPESEGEGHSNEVDGVNTTHKCVNIDKWIQKFSLSLFLRLSVSRERERERYRERRSENKSYKLS